MLYKCEECGYVFEEGDEVRVREPHGEAYNASPCCLSNFGEARKCSLCDEVFFEYDLSGDYCEDCLMNEVTYESALEFIKEKSSLAEFFLCFYYGAAERVEISRSLEIELEKIYKAKTDCDLQTGKHAFLDDIKDYVKEDLCDWAEFIKNREEGAE